MLNFQLMHMSYIDNTFRQHGSRLYKNNPRSVKCWQRVLATLNEYEKKVNGVSLYNDFIIIGNSEVIIEFTNELDKFISDHIYELTAINRDIAGNWNVVKDTLEKYSYDLISSGETPDYSQILDNML